MSESCNSRHFSWLMKSCFPNPHDGNCKSSIRASATRNHHLHHHRQSQSLTTGSTTLSSLPDDLLLECFVRVPSDSLSTLCFVCRRWSRLLHSPSFFNLRRHQNRLHNTVYALTPSASGFIASTLTFEPLDYTIFAWNTRIYVPTDYVFLGNLYEYLPQSRLASIGPRIFVIGRYATLRYDIWTDSIISLSRMLAPRKKFACAVVSDKIYIAGGSLCAAATVDEYDPDSNKWRVVSRAPRLRYGCTGASADGVFYVIGGLKIDGPPTGAADAQMYMSSMDLYDVEAGVWLRSRAVPGGGCVIAACAAVGFIYVLTSHAVEMSFWRFDARRRHGGFGEWSRMKTPQLAQPVRLDGSIKFSLVGVGNKVMLALMKNGRVLRSSDERFVWIYDTVGGDWSCGPDLPEYIPRATCVNLEC
ncbi:hypothetical protein AB3S75_010403 [Citrus x aurantiifolia]